MITTYSKTKFKYRYRDPKYFNDDYWIQLFLKGSLTIVNNRGYNRKTREWLNLAILPHLKDTMYTKGLLGAANYYKYKQGNLDSFNIAVAGSITMTQQQFIAARNGLHYKTKISLQDAIKYINATVDSYTLI